LNLPKEAIELLKKNKFDVSELEEVHMEKPIDACKEYGRIGQKKLNKGMSKEELDALQKFDDEVKAGKHPELQNLSSEEINKRVNMALFGRED
jgi:hypothetical protein